MTNIRKEFEKWKSRLDHYQISDYIWFDVWQASHESQQVRIDELLYQLEILDRVIVNDDKHATDKITALEARCRDLEIGLNACLKYGNKIHDNTNCSTALTYSSHLIELVKDYLSTKSPTEKEVR